MLNSNWINKIEEIDQNFFKDLKACSHKYENNTNPWHQECDGNVYGHTLLVYTKAKELFPKDRILHLAALLHDIGKPSARFEEDEKAKFYSHESLGVFYALTILNKLNLADSDKIRILELIQRHSDSYKLSTKHIQERYTTSAFKDLLKLRRCDMLGREPLQMKDIQHYNEETKIQLIDHHRVYNQTNPTCTLLVGPPCSGKSTYAKTKTANILSRDAIIMKLGNSTNYIDNWNSVDQQEVDRMFEENCKKFKYDKKDFIIDMTSMSYKSRNKHMQKFGKDFNYNIVVFLTPYIELLKRNEERINKNIKPYIIENMCKRFQFPYPHEQFHTKQYIFN